MSDSSNSTSAPTNPFDRANTTYTDARVVITPEAPRHYEVEVRKSDDEIARHAVERVVVNTAEVALDGPIWFIDVKVDVGVPVDDTGDTAWIWA
jgi:phage baseplate assembly protein gpV